MNSNPLNPEELRRQAESQLITASIPGSESYSKDKLLHELRVHQIELEMQNENLRQAYDALEESHQNYIDLYEFAPVGYVILSAKGIIEKINLTGTTLLGMDRQQLLQQRFIQLINFANRDRWQLFFWSLMRINTRKTIELMLNRNGNAPFHAQLDAVRVATYNQVNCLRIALTDISERKQLETLKTRCERYQLAENGGVDVIWDWNILTNQIDYSERWYKMLGYWNDVFHNTFACWESLLHPDDHDETLKRLRQHLNEHTPYVVEYRLRKRGGQYLWLFASGQAIWNDQGQPIRMIGTVSDITERKQAEIKLVNAQKLAETTCRFKSEFLANMSHEIRTPMNAIIGFTHLLQHSELNSQQYKYLNRIDTSAHILLSIINDILDLSRIEMGKLKLEQSIFSLDELLLYLSDIVELDAQQKNIKLEFSVASQTPHLLIGDSLRLGQIVLNLLSNAIKFSDNGEILLSIEPEWLNSTMACLRFSVQDNGIGISPEQIQTLFQPFSQADSSITRKYGGTGLGLAISKHLAELMGGRIWVESEVGKGSTFSFTATLGISTQDFPVSISCETEYIATDLAERRVLLVEDSEINREVAIALMADLGIQVEIAENGKQGFERATTEAFDLVLMDIQMPEMDGLTATRLIRADKRFQDLPIIAMTAHAMNGDREKSLAAGMNDYLTKPIEPQKLADTLSRWINIKMQSSQAAAQAQMPNDDLLPLALPPFDIAAALHRMKGNTSLLHRLILMFYDNFSNTSTELPKLIAAGNYEDAERLAHTLRSTAAMLEIEELPAVAAVLESAIQNHDTGKINLLLNTLEAVLTPAINAASSLNTQKQL